MIIIIIMNVVGLSGEVVRDHASSDIIGTYSLHAPEMMILMIIIIVNVIGLVK